MDRTNQSFCIVVSSKTKQSVCQLKWHWWSHGSSLPEVNFFPRLQIKNTNSTANQNRCRKRNHNLFLLFFSVTALHSIVIGIVINFLFIRHHLSHLPIKVSKSVTSTRKPSHLTHVRCTCRHTMTMIPVTNISRSRSVGFSSLRSWLRGVE
ncbi:hypothetical protein V8G54_006915 [Vigna mungo]|uniref:Transmembrane protein n=1 Tax=Vigna mungo TaxID=3915 RepID=A0AAQ3S7U2_VIGMU